MEPNGVPPKAPTPPPGVRTRFGGTTSAANRGRRSPQPPRRLGRPRSAAQRKARENLLRAIGPWKPPAPLFDHHGCLLRSGRRTSASKPVEGAGDVRALGGPAAAEDIVGGVRASPPGAPAARSAGRMMKPRMMKALSPWHLNNVTFMSSVRFQAHKEAEEPRQQPNPWQHWKAARSRFNTNAHRSSRSR